MAFFKLNFDFGKGYMRAPAFSFASFLACGEGLGMG
jgi:hypothetical protein